MQRYKRSLSHIETKILIEHHFKDIKIICVQYARKIQRENLC